MINNEIIEKYGQQYDAFYIYRKNVIKNNIARLQGAFANAQLLYSVKCNNHPQVLECIFSQGVGADAASVGEVELALKNGVPKEKILYSAPGKTVKMLEQALGKCIIVADSFQEVLRLEKLAAEKNQLVEIGVRINPDFTVKGEGGAPNKFGIDEAQAEALLNMGLEHVRIVGFHVHVRSQLLDSCLLERIYSSILKIADKMFYSCCRPLKYVNLGSGVGIPYVADVDGVNLETLGASISSFIASYKQQHPETEFYLESGRFISGTAGEYYTKVVDKKESYGKNIVLLAHTLSGFLRIATSKIWTQFNLPEAEPLYCAPLLKSIRCHTSSDDLQVVSIYGSLCTGMDCIAEDVELPKLEIGDFVSFPNAGAYGAVISPMQFSSLEKPAEIVI